MGICKQCGESAPTISDVLGFCADCIRDRFEDLWPEIRSIHEKSRRIYELPIEPPRAEDGISCPQCFHGCIIPEDGKGYCGVRSVQNGKLRGGRPQEGNLSYYYDPLPTNCVADFVCPGGGDCGYPEYSVSKGPEYGYRNLAVFYQACSFNCLYCQNHHFRDRVFSSSTINADQLASAVDNTTSCVCYFGGDPSPQIVHALRAASLAVASADHSVLRICWETNGAMKPVFLKRMARLSMKSGGCIKFDIKAWDNGIHHSLCGVPNHQTMENFKWLSRFVPERPEPPFLVASTLLVPGYVDVEEVGPIAVCLAKLNPEIPYRLLAFHPEFILRDLPRTSAKHAMRCKEAAEQAGLKRISIGNLHLLGDDYS